MRPIDRAAQALGIWQRSYQSVFGEGTVGQRVMVDLAVYCGAFKADEDDISHDMLMTMHGRRQAYFLIVNQLKLSPVEIEGVYRGALMRAAGQIPTIQGEE